MNIVGLRCSWTSLEEASTALGNKVHDILEQDVEHVFHSNHNNEDDATLLAKKLLSLRLMQYPNRLQHHVSPWAAAGFPTPAISSAGHRC